MFMPAPRPQSRLNPDEAKRLSEATADLGFARPTSSDLTADDPAKKPAKGEGALTTDAPSSAASSPTGPAQTLRLDVPDETWAGLKLEALKRRVTVRYLVLEALSKSGYPVDLNNIPEDGRRIR